ncbi:hypothetical protein NA57DRAFT_18809, partial [Rhizodiscina lignyota]
LPEDSMVARIDALLERARVWKASSSVDLPLPVLEFSGAKGLPLEDPKVSAQVHNGCVEVAARQVFQRIAASADIHDPAFADVWNLFDIVNICGDHGQCDSVLVWQLIEELLEVESIDGCRIAFDYLDSRRERLTAKNFKAKQLIILRSCNELLRRLSRAEDTVFCGRVYIFLFQSFPLGDKSSVNLRGEFHTENVTTFEEEPPAASNNEVKSDENEPQDTLMADSDKPATADTVTITISDGDKTSTESAKEEMKEVTSEQLYPIFWTLQKAFSNPPRIFSDENLSEFKSGLDATLAMFKKVPRVIQATSSDEKRGVKRKAGEAFDEIAGAYNPKYLTSRELFTLELSDLAFQRHILVQALILLDFLLSLSEKAKEDTTNLTIQKALQYPFTLSEQDADWATKMRTAIAGYLQDGPEGKFYYRMVDTVLSRDQNWVRWKMENCPPISKPPVVAQEFVTAKVEARKAFSVPRKRSAPMGTLDLAFLANNAKVSSLQGLEKSERYNIPTTESVLRDIDTDVLDLDMATTDDEKNLLEHAMQNKTWRLLRCMAKEKLRLFNSADDGKNMK